MVVSVTGTAPAWDAAMEAELLRRIDGKTKPVGSLGAVETIAAAVARTRRSLTPRLEACDLTIFAADHGIAREGVSAYPQAVTRQMVLNFLAGGAAANVMSRALGVGFRVVDAGIAGEPIDHPALISRRIGPGTRSFLDGPAMTVAELDAALDAGRALGADGVADAVAFGEMGIGNTSAAALVAHKLTGTPLADLVGRGTGLADAGLERKRVTLEGAAARTAPVLDPRAALAEYGGFEVAMMAGAMLGGAAAGRVVLVDGFIAAVAALAAVAIDPAARGPMIFAHRSAERGHGAVLASLAAEPILDLGLRLGEGTGALLAWPIVKASAAMLSEMSSFETAGVSGPA
ncbi:nicotinate-nucleotide--dimethylbenzimidazole phosphoribosyltransferase [Amaricoccus macauensis]|uniref:Nicotinate-nucleotide--dimethylbenzimidazole phosphoribosyltransferase n=1 Tax=Amaricoccus macauensis TaxID=57001 RepID=A0A840SF52_9RHOB|nr:nicotinate-nucleotide--dimethylbenzimidazole phosphoribosyltransferase [Amaricoccus macauensis]MBB5220467.1 nicotinate-nucleotide--dimethylbenzimidazole phosphoribosyltransferase [Amaricoccus macauensis]